MGTYDSLFRDIFENFERLLHWAYPGLLFWPLLPATFTTSLILTFPHQGALP